MGLYMGLTRLPPARLDAVIEGLLAQSLEEWREVDFDLSRADEADRTTPGPYRRHFGIPELGHASMGRAFGSLFVLLDPAGYEGGPGPTTPLGAAVRGWHPLPEWFAETVGVYHARYNTAEEVRVISAALDAADFDALFDGNGGVLERVWVYWRGDREDLRPLYEVLRAFYAAAAGYGQAVTMDVG